MLLLLVGCLHCTRGCQFLKVVSSRHRHSRTMSCKSATHCRLFAPVVVHRSAQTLLATHHTGIYSCTKAHIQPHTAAHTHTATHCHTATHPLDGGLTTSLSGYEPSECFARTSSWPWELASSHCQLPADSTRRPSSGVLSSVFGFQCGDSNGSLSTYPACSGLSGRLLQMQKSQSTHLCAWQCVWQ